MSSLFAILRAIFAPSRKPTAHGTDLDHMSARDWADLPPHHPLCD